VSAEFLYLSQEDVLAADGLDMAAAVAAVEEAFRLHAEHATVLPDKAILRWSPEPDSEETHGRVVAMPAYVGGAVETLGVKWITSRPANPREHGLPRANALIVLNDPVTGLPRAVMDGTVVSAMRTGASTAVAARRLARPDSRTLGLVGAGPQARTQLMGLHTVLPELRQVRLFDLDRERAQSFARARGAETGLAISVGSSAEEVISGSDLVVTATVAREPYLHVHWLAPGCFYADMAGQDCHLDVYGQLDRVVVDDWEVVRHYGVVSIVQAVENGLLDPSRIEELGPIVEGRAPGRRSAQERIVYRPIGLAIEDVAEAARVYRTAVERGLCTRLRLWEQPAWV
jgi:ornithine cyclodeaminase